MSNESAGSVAAGHTPSTEDLDARFLATWCAPVLEAARRIADWLGRLKLAEPIGSSAPAGGNDGGYP